MGMDEHGQKVAQTAAARGSSSRRQLVDRVAATFQECGSGSASRTTSSSAPPMSGTSAGVRPHRAIFDRNPDDFYERAYEGWYCVGCELFKREAEIEDGRCVLHPTRELEWTEERNWFFRLTRYEPFLREHFANNPAFLLPESRRNEILALLESGLEDISVTRSRLDWAIPFPRPTSTGETQGTWVWFDALPNYLTATGYPDPGLRDALAGAAARDRQGHHPPPLRHLAGDAACRRAAAPGGGLGARLRDAIGGERFSKSSGVRLDLDEAIDRHGADAFRYFLLREVPWDGDGGFTYERFDERYTSELANDLGNLANRSLAMLAKYRDGGCHKPRLPPWTLSWTWHLSLHRQDGSPASPRGCRGRFQHGVRGEQLHRAE
jgi:methionyl-tRNA synthetase